MLKDCKTCDHWRGGCELAEQGIPMTMCREENVCSHYGEAIKLYKEQSDFSTRLWKVVEEMKKMSLEIAQKDDLILMSGEVMRTIRDLEQIATKLEGGNMVDDYLQEIKAIMQRHREKSFITCPETCWCWDIEATITKHEVEVSQVMNDIIYHC